MKESWMIEVNGTLLFESVPFPPTKDWIQKWLETFGLFMIYESR